MLNQLRKYALDHGLVAEPGFESKFVRWGIHCDKHGNLLGVTELGHADQKGNRGVRFDRCPHLTQPEIKKGGPGCRHFLVDTAAVVALLGGDKDEKLLAKHSYFADLLRQAGEVGVLATSAAARCLMTPGQLESLRKYLVESGARPTDNVTFTVDGGFLVESDSWHDWWREFRSGLASSTEGKASNGGRRMRCFATGDLVEPALTQPKISGLSDVGGLSMGDALISFKQESFCSYGLTQSQNAAVSELAAKEYQTALNHLIREQGVRLVDTKVVHWFRNRVPPEDDPLPWLVGHEAEAEVPAAERAKALLNAIRTGRRPDLRDNEYYAMTLSGASGRVMVRGWMEGRFEDLVRNVDAWFEDLSIVRRDGDGLARPPKLLAILGGLVRDLKDLPSPIVLVMWQVALRQEPIPLQVLAQAMLRVRVDVIRDDSSNHARMGIIKAFHVRKGDEGMKPYLNEEHPARAYHCGRLMAVLAAVQYRALGDVGAGLVQRYYAAASTTPALVLGRLTRVSQFHLDKIQSPGLRNWFQGKIATIWAGIKDELPRTLTLEEQSLFALGYYHQIAADRARATDAAGASREVGGEKLEEEENA